MNISSSMYSGKKAKRYFAQDRTEMLSYIPSGVARVLEVGCGEGRFGLQIKKTCGAVVQGIELNPRAAQIALEHLDEVHVGNVEEIVSGIPDSQFDAIVLNDVLEHLLDPWSVLIELRQKLRPAGKIILSVPNTRYFCNLYRLILQGDWLYEDAGVTDRTHLRFFTKKSIVRAVEESGYIVETATGINSTNSWKARLLGRTFKCFLGDIPFLQICVVASRSEYLSTDGPTTST